MSASLNTVNLIGNLARDIELKYSASGTAILSTAIAVNKPPKKGEQNNGVDFIPVVIFGKTAEAVSRYCHKGSSIYVGGRIQTGSYVKQDGTKVFTVEVYANNVQFLGGNRDQQNATQKPRAFDDSAFPSELPQSSEPETVVDLPF